MDNTETITSSLEIYVDCLASINYAILSAGKSPVNACLLTNSGADTMTNLKLTLSGEHLKSQELTIASIPGNEHLAIDKLSLDFDADYLYNLQEPVTSHFTLEVSSPVATLLSKIYETRLYPKDYWFGIGIHPETIAAFITPNAPGVQHVLQNAGKWLEKLTGDSALDEYQTRDNNRVRYQVAAIYEALREESIVYAAPPASFVESGQRTRLAEQVLTDKLGTCLDLSLLFAACLEQANLNPIIILMRGHAFVGCWLEETHYPETACDDYTVLSKNIANGIHRLVLVEATCITSSDNLGFEDAAMMAEAKLNAGNDILFIDVKSARLQHIYPMASPSSKTWENEGVEHNHATHSIEEKTVIPQDELAGKGPLSREQIWERKLLDISLQNNLINMKLGVKCLPLFAFDLDFVEDELQKGREYRIIANPDSGKVELNGNGILDSRSYRLAYEDQIKHDIKNGILNSYLSGAELEKGLKNLYRCSRTAQEENGANTLYLALGILKWYETPRSIKPRLAPLLLLPVEIIRKGAGYIIRTREEDIFFNNALEEMLKQNFNVHIPGLSPLPVDESGCDVLKVFTIVRNNIMSQPRWDVLEESVLGLFSFSKFVMWNDVHSNLEEMRRNPIISALLNKGTVASEGDFVDASTFDTQTAPQDNAIPVDVDSSQLEAVLESGKGRSFILYGPPGTGKSQTITNMIANALFHGKRVLFVAEKMAALEVVQKRLAKIGLAPFCLELHSNKATKAHLLMQLEETLSTTRYKTPEEYGRTAEKLREQRQQMSHFAEAMHKKREDGHSLHDYITAYTAMTCSESIAPSEDFLHTEASTSIEDTANGITVLDKVIALSGHPAEHPLSGLCFKTNSPGDVQRVKELLGKLSKDSDTFIAAFESAGKSIGINAGTQLRYVPLYASLTNVASSISADALRLSADDALDRWHEACDKWFLPRYFAKKRVMKEVQQHFVTAITADNIESQLSALSAFQKLANDYNCLLSSADTTRLDNDSLQLIDSFVALWQELTSLADINADDLQTLAAKTQGWLSHFDRANTWLHWCSASRQLHEKHLERVVDFIQQSICHTPAMAAEAMKRGYYEYRINKVIGEDASLQLFNGLVFDEKIEAYRNTEEEFKQLTIAMLYCRLAAQIPSATNTMVNTSELGILKRYISSKGRGASIRKIMDQIPTLLPKLCPVMLMSPISVAQYLDLGQDKFDLVCFDEASQMPTSEAVGAIARGKALICVGDPKQMPPTSFFSSNTIDEEDAENDDMESILDDCITLSMPEKYLNWHYRSKHESLIAFSNSQYYDGQLFTFPSTDDKAAKVRCIKVEGSYDHGKTRCNKAEAEAIVDEVICRLQSEELSKRSIGIIAFSKVQQNLIEDILTERLAQDVHLEGKAYDVEEPIFVKNLENVQGDERDVILFSVGYGPSASGKVSMNFGPLNRVGGERRLNVAVSRARYEMIVFTIMSPEQIDLNRTNALGVVGLRRFLEFAQSGRMSIPAGQMETNETGDLVDQIAAKLRAKGMKVDTHVGRSKFKIDIAIQHPADKDRYILGVLCDGKNYSMTKTAREREISQPGFLRFLGWNLMRLWSLDWLNNQDMVLKQIQDKVASLLDGHEEPAAVEGNKASAFKGMEKVDIPTSAETMGREYITATPRKKVEENLTADDLFGSTYPIDDDILNIVQTEQPITLELLSKRIAHQYNIARVTKRFRKLTEKRLSHLYVDHSASADNPTVWTSKDAAAGYHEYRTNGGRDISEIPQCEMCNAIHDIVMQQVALPKDDLKRCTSKLLGFANMGAKIDKVLEECIGNMIGTGVLQMQDDKISLQ